MKIQTIVLTILAVSSLATFACTSSACATSAFSTTANRQINSYQSAGNPDPKRYPDHWWTAVAKEGAPKWEVLPQEAGPGEVILSKRNELGLLSNFAATPFVYSGTKYASLEGFWQMMKYPEGPSDPRATAKNVIWKFSRQEVGQMTAFEAKSAGKLGEENMKVLGIDWVTFENKQMEYRFLGRGDFYQVIQAAMLQKVLQNPAVKEVLLATGDLKLRPDHIQEPTAPAAWKYFDIWMELRAELQK